MTVFARRQKNMVKRAASIRIAAGGALFALAACATDPQTPPAAGPDAASAPSRPAIKASALMGARPQALSQLLGAPSLTRREGPGEFRRYAMAGCTLIVILYPDEKGDTRVVHLDAAAKNAGGAKPDVGECLAAG
ncbi:MAG: hypothetical protein AAGC95_13955 [Pseudomonadota bacterium]